MGKEGGTRPPPRGAGEENRSPHRAPPLYSQHQISSFACTSYRIWGSPLFPAGGNLVRRGFFLGLVLLYLGPGVHYLYL